MLGDSSLASGSLFAPIALGTPSLFFALLALRDKVHLFAERFGDTLRHHAFIEASNQLLYRLTFSSFYTHSGGPRSSRAPAGHALLASPVDHLLYQEFWVHALRTSTQT
jgi:hypothetical protein